MADTITAAPHEIAALFARCAPVLRKFFTRRGQTRTEADDLTQEVFSRLLRRANGQEPVVNFDGYVFQIADNLLKGRVRQYLRRRELAADALTQDWARGTEEFTPERIILGREACGEVAQALEELPERDRVVFVLNRFEDLPASEIALRLNVSISTVEKAMIRARTHIRRRLS